MATGVSDPVPIGDIDRTLGRLVEPALDGLAARLRSVGELSGAERAAVIHGATAVAREAVWWHASRVVLLEFHAARVTGKLTAADSRARWREWVAILATPDAWDTLAEHYPPLLPRLRAIAVNRCGAALTLATRFGRDRGALARPGWDGGQLTGVEFGAGDSHSGGQTVAMLHCLTGRIVYKPRSVEVDAVLGGLLPRLLDREPAAGRIRVPAVVTRHDQLGRYGWAEYVAHRYCDGDAELRTFYRGLGHWLAVMRLLSGSDLHAGNVIACGPVPVVVDCETLFTPHPVGQPSGYGAAVDLATEQISRSVLRTGLLPGRGAVLGWRGVDPSGAGALPGQQPVLRRPVILDQGTDAARIGLAEVSRPPAANHPSPEPDLGRYWSCVLDGFTELTGRLQALDRAGELAPLMAEFGDCPVRVVLRDTESYAELAWMLWHPSSLHQPEAAARRAGQLLTRNAANQPGVPSDPAVIEAEVADLLHGDVPAFVTTPRSGELVGPGGTRWGLAEDLIATALGRWRNADLAADRRVVQGALVGAYLNDQRPPKPSPATPRVRTRDLDRRRRAQAALIMRRLLESAVRGEDGTATWIAPTEDETGWAVRPLAGDLYSGNSGMAVVLAGYLCEEAHDRADPVPGLEDLLAAVVRTMRRCDEQQEVDRQEAIAAGIQPRPQPAGGYLGLGSRIWAWLLLSRLAAVGADEALRRACALADLLPEAVAADDRYDLLTGMAGAVVPLLRLSEHTGQDRWVELARQIGGRLQAVARPSGDGVCWPSASFPDGTGGLSHGATGIGWALARLSAVTGEADFRAVAEAAFGWEEARYDPELGGWRNAWAGDRSVLRPTWCHGAVGIGLSAADLLARERAERWPDLLHRAAGATWPAGIGQNSTLCHGGFGAWEVLDRAAAAGLGPTGLAMDTVVAGALSHLEGAASDSDPDLLWPGLLSGRGGIAYQLLRMHPASRLPSVLLPDPGPADR